MNNQNGPTYAKATAGRQNGRSDRHHDQMVQAARSGYQNIAEGSEDSATSKKLEMNLTNVARSSQDEARGATTSPPQHNAWNSSVVSHWKSTGQLSKTRLP